MPLRQSTGVLIVFVLFLTTGLPAYAGQEVGIAEKLGQVIPLDLTFKNELGKEVVLHDLVTKPTILVFVYHSCSHTCPTLLAGLSEVLSQIEPVPGRDFSILTVSFDETDTPALAAQKKKDYVKAAARDFPEGSWNFLTGDDVSISRLTAAAGFGFKRAPNGFAHPVSLILLSPQGKITRYLYGVKFLPMDLTLALTEASRGLAVPTVRKLLLYCYSYDPEGRRYVFNILRITGIATLLFIGLFIGWLTLSGRRRGRRGPGAQP